MNLNNKSKAMAIALILFISLISVGVAFAADTDATIGEDAVAVSDSTIGTDDAISEDTLGVNEEGSIKVTPNETTITEGDSLVYNITVVDTNGNTKTSFDASFVGSGSNVTISGGDLQSNIVRGLNTKSSQTFSIQSLGLNASSNPYIFVFTLHETDNGWTDNYYSGTATLTINAAGGSDITYGDPDDGYGIDVDVTNIVMDEGSTAYITGTLYENDPDLADFQYYAMGAEISYNYTGSDGNVYSGTVETEDDGDFSIDLSALSHLEGRDSPYVFIISCSDEDYIDWVDSVPEDIIVNVTVNAVAPVVTYGDPDDELGIDVDNVNIVMDEGVSTNLSGCIYDDDGWNYYYDSVLMIATYTGADGEEHEVTVYTNGNNGKFVFDLATFVSLTASETPYVIVVSADSSSAYITSGYSEEGKKPIQVTVTVNELSSTGPWTIGSTAYESLDAAIAAADNGDTIVGVAGTYTVNPMAINKNITIKSDSEIDAVVLDASGVSKVFDIARYYELNLNNIAIINAVAGLNNSTISVNGTLKTNNVSFDNCDGNKTTQAVIKVNANGLAIINDTTFNNCLGDIGIVYNMGNMTINNSRFNGNIATTCVVYAYGLKTIVDNTNFTSNLITKKALPYGACVYAQAQVKNIALDVSNSYFANNVAEDLYSVGIASYGYTMGYSTYRVNVTATGNSFVNNTALNETIFFYNPGTNVISGNTYENTTIGYLISGDTETDLISGESRDITLALANPNFYDDDLISRTSYLVNVNDANISSSSGETYAFAPSGEGTYNVYFVPATSAAPTNTLIFNVIDNKCWFIGETGYSTLAEAVAAAADGDKIEGVAGTYSMDSSILLEKNITIAAKDGAEIILNGNGHGMFTTPQYGSKLNLTFDGLIFTNAGYSSNVKDAAIYAENSNVLINNCTFIDNTKDTSAASTYSAAPGLIVVLGMDSNSVDLIINDSKFINNHIIGGSYGAYGVVEAKNARLTIMDSYFENNSVSSSSAYGGSWPSYAAMGVVDVVSDYSTTPAKIEGTEFINSSADNGAAIYFYANANLTVINSEFTDDIAAVHGGAIYDSANSYYYFIYANNTYTNCTGANEPIYLLNGVNEIDLNKKIISAEDLEVIKGTEASYTIYYGSFDGAGVSGAINLTILNDDEVVDSVVAFTDDNGNYNYDVSNLPYGKFTTYMYSVEDPSINFTGNLGITISDNPYADFVIVTPESIRFMEGSSYYVNVSLVDNYGRIEILDTYAMEGINVSCGDKSVALYDLVENTILVDLNTLGLTASETPYEVNFRMAGSGWDFNTTENVTVFAASWFIGENGFETIEDALEAADDGDKIEGLPGIYAVETPILVDKNVTITSKEGQIVFDGQNKTSIFKMDNNYDPLEVTLENMVFINVNETPNFYSRVDAFAIYARYTNLTLNNCVFANNTMNTTAGAYGLVRVDASKRYVLLVNNCTFENNYLGTSSSWYGVYGAAISSNYVDVIVKDSRFENNTAEASGISAISYGGAIDVYGAGNSLIENSSFINNFAEYGGAVAYREAAGNLTVLNSTFIDDNATYHGGAIYDSSAFETSLVLDPENVYINCNLTENDTIFTDDTVYADNNVKARLTSDNIISAKNINDYVGEDLSYIVSYTDNETNPLFGKEINITIVDANTEEIIDSVVLVTGEEGTVSYSIKELAAGNYIAKAYVVENESYSIENSIDLRLGDDDIYIIVLPETVEMLEGKSKLITIKIVDEYGLPITFEDYWGDIRYIISSIDVSSDEITKSVDFDAENPETSYEFDLAELELISNESPYTINVVVNLRDDWTWDDLVLEDSVSVMVLNSNEYIQALIDAADPGDVIDLGDLVFDDVGDINVTKNLTITGGVINPADDANAIFNIVDDCENVTIRGMTVNAIDDTIIVSALAEDNNGASEIAAIDIEAVTVNIAEDNNPNSVVILKVSSDSNIFNPTNAITVSGNTFVSGVSPFVLENTYWNDGTDVVIPVADPIKTVFNIEEVSTGEGIVRALLKDVNGKVLANKNVTIVVGEESTEAVTDDAGSVIIDGLKSSALVTFVFAGDDGYDASIAEIEFTSSIPVKKATEILCQNMTTFSILSSRSGDYFTAQLVDGEGHALAGKDVQIGFNGKIYDRTTNETGGFRLQVNLVTAGGYTFAISFLGDDEYNASFSVAKITVKKNVATLKAGTSSIKAGSNKVVKFTLTTPKGAVASQKVSLKINGKTYTASTDSKGVAQVKVSITTKGSYSYTASFAGTSTIAAATATGTLKVQ